MEFKFRGIDDRTAPYRSSPSSSSQTSSYVSDQALLGSHSMDPNFLNNPRHLYTIQREIEKQIIRQEIITHEIITAEIERRRLLEEEVRRELMIEKEMAMYRAREMGLSIDDRFSMQLHTSYPVMQQFNNCWLEDRLPFPWNPGMGFGHNGLPPTFLPHFSQGPWSGLEVNKKDKLITLPKPDANICGSKQKAATPPAGSGELPSTSSNKTKEWSCAICQVSATTEKGLDVHLQGKKHRAKEKLLRDLKMCISSTSKKSMESRDSADQEMKPNVEEESVKSNKTVVGLDQKVEGGQTLQVKPNSNLCGSNQKAAAPPAGSGELPSTNSNKPKEWSCALCQVSATTERGLDEHLQGRKHKAKVAGLLRDKKMYSNSTSSTSKESTESRDGVGQEMKTKVQEESVKGNKTVVGLDQKVEGGLDEHPQGKKQKAKEEEQLGAQKWIKKSTESRDSAGQEMKTKVEEESVKANRTVVGLDQKEDGCEALQVKPYPNLCGSKQEATTLPAGSGELPLTSSEKPMDWSCALCQVSTTSKRDLDEHLQGKKHKAKEEELLGDQKMCSNSTSKNSAESRDSAGQEIKGTVEEESVKANKTIVGLDQKVEGGQDEHLQAKKHKAKEVELIGAQKMCTTSSSSTSGESGKTIKLTESRDSADQEIKAKVEVGLDQKVEGEEDSKNKNEELPKKDLSANTPKTTNGMLTGEKMKRKLPLRENFEFWCEVCQVGTHAAVVMEGHKRGKKHMACSNKSKKNDESVPPTTCTTIVKPSEATEKAEDEDVVAGQSNEETAESVIEMAEDEEVVVYRGR